MDSRVAKHDGRPAWGMVHGRFQPFHHGHLHYLTAAAERCERLLVGITNPDRSSISVEPRDPLRHLPAANPYTYTERLLMVEAVLADVGLSSRAHVIPFPISTPAVWDDYVPQGTVHYLRLLSPWGQEKVDRLGAAGYEVVVLDPGARKEVSGTEVRQALRAGDPRWTSLVPPGAARIISSLPHAPDADPAA